MTKISHQGFSLVEMALVLFIISLLIGGLLIPLSTQMDQSRLKATQQDLKNIYQALLGFALINGHLPCPDINNDGIQDNPTSCDTEGDLPWITLAIGRKDAWGQPFRYRVDAQYTTQPFPNPPDTSSNLRVRDKQEHQLTNESVNSDVIAIILSLGKDGQANDENGGVTDNIYTQ
ncbi:MAG: type II secretion system protein GspG, partial [Pseudomonadota bacterium]